MPGRETFRRTPVVAAFPIPLPSSGPNFGNTSDNFDKVILGRESADNPEKVRRARYGTISGHYLFRDAVSVRYTIIIPLKTA